MFRILLPAFLAVFATILNPWSASASPERPPNFVIIFLDDSGWSDFSPFGSPPYSTPQVERLADEGCRFNRFYVPQAVCSASRAALLTGCYPGRSGVVGAHGPRGRGLDPAFATLAEVLKPVGYATGSFGKWHIGDQPDTRPPARGFDESSGLMYSNDMWRYHPGVRHFDKHPLQYWKNGDILIQDVTPEDQKSLTGRGTDDAVAFINRHAGQPFFLYVPYSMPHVPLYCSEAYEGRSGAGLYGDVMLEIDGSVGRILEALEKNGLGNNTLVLFTSDNGPWLSYGNHAGSTPFREGKGTSFDGGKRNACVVRFPRLIQPGTRSDIPWSSIDILPTFAELAGAPLPENPIDGKPVTGILAGKPDARNPHAYYAFSLGRELQAVMSGDGRWKLHRPHGYRTLVEAGKDGQPGTDERRDLEWSLFDLEADPGETTNVMEANPRVAERLRNHLEAHAARFYAKNRQPEG